MGDDSGEHIAGIQLIIRHGYREDGVNHPVDAALEPHLALAGPLQLLLDAEGVEDGLLAA